MQGEGIAYRGRMLVEIKTSLDEKPEVPKMMIEPDDVGRVSKFMRRHRFMLNVAFLEATMIYDTDAPVEFEVSIGQPCYICLMSELNLHIYFICMFL